MARGPDPPTDRPTNEETNEETRMLGAQPKPSSRALLAALLFALAGGCGSTSNDSSGGGADPFAGKLESSCDGGKGGFGLECNARIAVFDLGTGTEAKQVYNINTGDVDASGLRRFEFEIRNTGNKDLGISRIELAYEPASAVESAQPALTCKDGDGAPCAGATWPIVKPLDKGGQPARFAVVFKRYDDDKKRSGILRVHSTAVGKSVVQIAFTTAAGTPRIKVQPSFFDFKFVKVGDERVEAVTLYSIGNADLVISQMELKLEADLFKVIVKGKEYSPGAPVTFEPALVIPKGGTLPIKALYRGVDDKPHNGAVVLHTNDSSLTARGGAGYKAINVKVNSTGPCLLLNPSHVVFGATPLGKGGTTTMALHSCGDLPVEITRMVFAAPGPGEFGVDWNSIGGRPGADKPLVIGVNQSRTLSLTYNPEAVNPVQNGKIQEDTATLELYSNVIAGVSKATLSGFASSSTCPTAVIKIPQGDTVVPQTVLDLDGTASFAQAGGTITKYRWEVQQPTGSVALFKPNAQLPKVQFQPNVAGDYVFRLRVWDGAGKESCTPAEKKIKVLPDQAIHVELLWDTPGDPDQSDEGPAAGADLDLHFAHPFGSGLDFDGDKTPDPWFDPTYDAFWFNKSPEWGSYDPNVDDNPSLDRDDTDGAGPENLNLTVPENGMSYAVGVHYFNDFGKGPSTAEVRIYIYGQLQFKVKSVPLHKGDMWYVATIDWPSGNIAAKKPLKAGTKFFITPKYPHPPL